MGAGVIPFAVHENNLYFLFQSTFSGRKTGYLIDFGGGLGIGEDFRETAIREFVEETETMYFSDDLLQASRITEKVNDQIPIVDALFEKTLLDHPDWWCRRSPSKRARPKQWKTFFIEFPYRDINELNKEWKEDKDGRFRKRRKLTWVEVSDLLAIYENKPKKLWKRVRQLEYAPNVIRAIQRVRMQ